MLKRDERNKFFRDARWSLDIETNEHTCKKGCEAQGEGLGMQEAAERHRAGEFRYWDKMHARRCWKKAGNKHVDIEARWPQKIGEREAGGRGKLDIGSRMSARSCCDEGGAYILRPHECRKLLRGTGGGHFRYWNKMHARNCGEATGEPDMKPNECKMLLKTLDNQGRYCSKINAGSCYKGHRGGSSDIETRWAQDVVGRLGGKPRYWNPMSARSSGIWWEGHEGES